MVPTLPPGKIVIGLRVFKRLKPGHVIVFRQDDKEMIKRVSKLSTDGIFVVGDQPEHSIDSRHFGPISHKQVVARVVYPRVKRRRSVHIPTVASQKS